jgi:hypothetical protein
MLVLRSILSHSPKPQEALNLLVIEESYWALFYMPLYTLFTQFAECTSTQKISSIFTGRGLVTASNSGDTSASVLKANCNQWLTTNCQSLLTTEDWRPAGQITSDPCKHSHSLVASPPGFVTIFYLLTLWESSYHRHNLYFCGTGSLQNLTTGWLVKVKVILRPTIRRPVCLGVRHPSGTRDQFISFLQLFFRRLRICWCGVSSLTIGRVYSFLFLLGIASEAFLRSESHGTH